MSIALLPLVLALTPLDVQPSPPRSVAEAWSRFSACDTAPNENTEQAWRLAIECRSAARDVLHLGDESDRARLWDRFDAADTDERVQWLLFGALLDSYLDEAVRELDDSRTTAVPFRPSDEPKERPGWFDQASPALQAAV